MQRQILTMMDVRIRLAAAVLWMIALLMTKHAGTPVIMAVILCCIIACDSGMSVHEAFHHLRHVAPFIFLMLITLSLSDGVPLTREAVGFALLISARVMAAVFIVIAMTAGSSTDDFIRGIAVLPLPPVILSMLFLVNRYIHLLTGEFRVQTMALKSRMFVPKAHPSVLKNIGYVIGGMFIRNYDRSEHVYMAMRSRCFLGVIPFEEQGRIKGKDLVGLLVTAVVATIIIYVDWTVMR